MAVHIKPCFGCPVREGCDLRKDFQARARRLGGALAVTFECKRLADVLRPGRRIVVPQPVMIDEGGEGERIGRVHVNATIINTDTRGRFSCVVDPGELDDYDMADEGKREQYRFRRRAPHTRIVRFLDELDAPICEFGNVRRGDRCDTLRDPCWCDDPRREDFQ